jgi:hypothetical protein
MVSSRSSASTGGPAGVRNASNTPRGTPQMQTSNISNPKSKKRKRKLSDLTTEQVSNVVSLLKNLMADLDEEDKDGQIVIENVQNVIRKLSQDTVCPVFFHCRWPLMTLSEASFLLRSLPRQCSNKDSSTEMEDHG